MGEPRGQICPVVFVKGEEHWSANGEIGQRLFDLAHLVEAPVETTCNGVGSCIRCKVKVVHGELSPPTPLERDRLGNIFHITKERLACQATLCGPVQLEIPEPRRRRSKFIRR